MKNLSPLLYVLILSVALLSFTNSECKKDSDKTEKLEIQYTNEMMSYIDKQIKNGILFGQASRTVQLCCPDTFSVINAYWLADSKEKNSKREIQIYTEEVSKEDIRNNFKRTSSLK